MSERGGDDMGKARARRKKVSVAGCDGGSELGAARVDDPFEPGATIRVVKNLRSHPLDHMLARRQISAAQAAAGEAFLAIYERAEIGGARAIDYSVAKVDVSYVHRGLDLQVMAATRRLQAIRGHVGARPYALLRAVIGERRTPGQLADGAPDGPCDRRIWHIFEALREALDELIEHFGVARGPASRRIVGGPLNAVDLTTRESDAYK